MARDSSIEWTNHTFNPWWGCEKVSPACTSCYAERWARRLGLDIWGGRSPRRFFTDAHWNEPLRWNRRALDAGIRERVFCASMADVFEAREDLRPWRQRLWDLIDATPALDWLLLTKRPENVLEMVPWKDRWPRSVWLGTTVEDQIWARRRVPRLLEIPAVVRFVSCEPLLGSLELRPWLRPSPATGRRIDWVIAGGESGPHARPMDPRWARDLRDECVEAAVPFHFKQWGEWVPDGDDQALRRLGKKTAGRLLDERTWDEFPNLVDEQHVAEASA